MVQPKLMWARGDFWFLVTQLNSLFDYPTVLLEYRKMEDLVETNNLAAHLSLVCNPVLLYVSNPVLSSGTTNNSDWISNIRWYSTNITVSPALITIPCATNSSATSCAALVSVVYLRTMTLVAKKQFIVKFKTNQIKVYQGCYLMLWA